MSCNDTQQNTANTKISVKKGDLAIEQDQRYSLHTNVPMLNNSELESNEMIYKSPQCNDRIDSVIVSNINISSDEPKSSRDTRLEQLRFIQSNNLYQNISSIIDDSSVSCFYQNWLNFKRKIIFCLIILLVVLNIAKMKNI